MSHVPQGQVGVATMRVQMGGEMAWSGVTLDWTPTSYRGSDDSNNDQTEWGTPVIITMPDLKVVE